VNTTARLQWHPHTSDIMIGGSFTFTTSKVSQKRPKGRPPKQKEPQGPREPQEPSATVIEPIKKMVSVHVEQ
jgi:hypothetical protein